MDDSVFMAISFVIPIIALSDRQNQRPERQKTPPYAAINCQKPPTKEKDPNGTLREAMRV
jgi:hypothetical protein